ncbi:MULTISPECIES: FAD/NAD(P)-binding oxidoreductase [unclassified Duganella]|uniref:NAD(P)/FAD-dependent oxidoreductase n=1 Tax=unclassified Duganella TaxID=2636909 RepID=UPI0006F25E0B|nr:MULTISPECIES: FAD/NAD(P)-binding oxidoreductase [unclassified Duganella]KQV59797.1 FAD/NAD(P)-binding oxidoreductase [Duganella sp. Root336D2]KRB87276.1 FAD/NAD(P)-binding oxidoreductase [Duganella sp. Root198D2]
MTQFFDILIVGAGPAGLAAAHAAASNGNARRIAIVDDNPLAGGQIWRGGPAKQQDQRARQLWQALEAASNVTIFPGTRVLMQTQPGELLVQDAEQARGIRYNQLILATGARELLLPFPGWTLPGVTGAGGLQALAKGGYPVQGKRVVVAGSGPLLLAVAATLKDSGAIVSAIVEQAGMPVLARFAAGLALTPSKAVQAAKLGVALRGIPYLANSYVTTARGDVQLTSVQVQRKGGKVDIDCDYLACGYGLLPNTELARALGCDIEQGAVKTDLWQRTSVPNVLCAGEGTGVGGVDLALVEGRIAGLAACGEGMSQELFTERAKWQGFGARLARAFSLRQDLRKLAQADTIVCRCEDVCHDELREHASWRSAKLHTRCGMGPCQGRICGNATDFLYGWRPDAVRTPISPARAGSIITLEPHKET